MQESLDKGEGKQNRAILNELVWEIVSIFTN